MQHFKSRVGNSRVYIRAEGTQVGAAQEGRHAKRRPLWDDTLSPIRPSVPYFSELHPQCSTEQYGLSVWIHPSAAPSLSSVHAECIFDSIPEPEFPKHNGIAITWIPFPLVGSLDLKIYTPHMLSSAHLGRCTRQWRNSFIL